MNRSSDRIIGKGAPHRAPPPFTPPPPAERQEAKEIINKVFQPYYNSITTNHIFWSNTRRRNGNNRIGIIPQPIEVN